MAGDDVVDTWRIHARICSYVLDAVVPEALTASTELKGRSVGGQFAHLHNVRLMWLKSAAPDLHEGLEKVDEPAAGDKDRLRRSLDASAAAVEALLGRALDAGRVKGFKPHPTAFVGYLVAHEAYHQGDIGVRLTAAGFPLPRTVAYGMWEWGVR
jgi:uncharacterized damage-inducible protein DinB